ncbi:MAG: hypothetical protein MUO80_02275 [Dehalococcoidia bacterium]|nr:hypothetical protein [Dehalococcoidia bacterium]
MAAVESVDEDYFNLGTVQAGESILLSLRLSESSTLRPVIEIRDGHGGVVQVEPNPTSRVARANIVSTDIYYAVVVALTGEGTHGQYILDAVVTSTGELEYADLAVTEISAPVEASSGETVHLEWTVGNFGTGSSYVDAWYDRVILSTNERYGDPDDIQIAFWQHTGVLSVGDEYTVEIDVRLPIGRAGSYWIFVETDDNNRVFEYIFEGNNIRQSDSQILIELTPYADIAANNVSVPLEAIANEPITVTWSVGNEGTGITGNGTPDGIVDQWTDRIVFSRNNVYGEADDRLVAEVLRSGALNPGESYQGNWTGTLPGGLSGYYYVFIFTDSSNGVYEYTDTHSNLVCSSNVIKVRQWIIEPGTITEDTIWSGLLKILGGVTIATGATLTIEPGSILKFTSSSAGLNIQGTLNATGTLENPIIFTSWKDDTAGGDSNDDGDATSPAAGDWAGLTFSSSTAVGTLENVQVRYAATAIGPSASDAKVTLRRAVLRNSGTGIYSWTTYAQVEADNCLIINNNQAMYIGGTCGVTLRNCIISGNGNAGTIGHPILNLENSIIAFNDNGFSGWPSPDDLEFRNCVFYSPVGPVISWIGETTFRVNGNIAADPLFVNLPAGNYELSEGSPAIDAGRGINAPATDILGRPRYDDPGMANVGAGYPSYVDIGAFERQQPTLARDLAVTAVTDPLPIDVHTGDPFAVNWTVTNTGERDLEGEWADAVYLSSDPYLSLNDDHLLAQATHSTGLAIGQSYTGTCTGAVPAGVAGPQYILVYTNQGKAFRESSVVNNVLASPVALAVDVPVITVNTPQTGTIAQGEWDIYRFEAQPGRTVRFALDSVATSGACYLYIRRGAPPTVSAYDFAGAVSNQPDQEARLLNPVEGTYYISIYAQRLGAITDYALSATLANLQIQAITPNTVGNADTATVKIVGDNFRPDTEVELVAADERRIPAAEYYQDASTLFATFDLAGASASAGVYDVVVTNPGPESTTKFDAMTVTAGGAAQFKTNLVLPGTARPGREISIRIEFANTGNVDLPSPLLTIESVEDTTWKLLSGEWVSGSTISVLALSSDGPAAILRPGQSGSLELRVRTPFNPGEMPFKLYAFGLPGDPGLGEAIDWNKLNDELRPVDTPSEAWDPLFARLKAQVGNTWGDYLRMLRDNAAHLSELEQRNPDPGELFAFEFVQAYSMGVPSYLESSQDAFCPALGLPLSFERYFLPGPSYRARLGSLGRGWTHSYEITLRSNSDNTVVINGIEGFDRTFNPDGSGGYIASTSDYGRLTSQSGGECLLTEKNGLCYHFRADGRFDYIEEPNGNHIMAAYDNQGRLIRVIHSNGDRFILAYDANGRLASLTDQANRITTYTYDASGEHLLSVTTPDGRTTSYTYITGTSLLKDHHLASIVRPGGVQISFSYDSLGRLIEQHIAANDESIYYAYSAAGKTFVSNAHGDTTTTWIDSQGTTARIENPIGSATNMAYDDNSNLIAVVGPTGLETFFTYDDLGNLVSSQDPMGYVNSFGYSDNFSSLLWVRDARANKTSYSYDSTGNLISVTYPDGTLESYTYDGSGRLTCWTNRRGQTIGYTPNDRGQLIEKSYPDDAKCTYDYDDAGRLVAATDTQGTTTFEYYPNTDFLKKISYPQGCWLQFTYDSAGRRASSLDQLGHRLDYLYDAAGRLESLTDENGAEVVHYTYDADGRLVREDKGNGVYTTYEYDAAGQLLHLVNYKPDDSVLSRFDYTYDALGCRISMGTIDGNGTYQYDNNGQLTHAVLDSVNPEIPDQDLAYVYDAVGNRIRTTENGITIEYTTNNMNQYIQVGDTTYTFDADGNLVQEVSPEGTTDYTFNDENRLVRGASPQGTWQYTYDAFGNRVATTENGMTTHYVIDPVGLGNVVGEYDTDGKLIRGYDHGLGLLLGSDAVGNTVFYTFDASGSTSEVTTDAGAILNRYAYAPFGRSLYSTATIVNKFQYVGEAGVAAEQNGLLFMRSRYFSPALGRFVQEDRIGIMGGLNLYRYGGNNPLNFIDPSGDILLYVVGRLAIENFRYGNWYGMYWSGGRRTSNQNIRETDLESKPINQLDAAARLHDLLLLIGVPNARTIAENWYAENRDRGLGRGPKPLEWVFRHLIAQGGTPRIQLTEEMRRKIRVILLSYNLPNPIWQQILRILTSWSPEDKWGPAGYDEPGTSVGSEKRCIPAGQTMDYRIEIWNKPEAPVPTQDAVIKDTLDPDFFDLSTFEFTRVGFLKWDVPLLGGQAVDTRVDCRPDMNIAVDIKGTFNPETGEIEWWFHTVDPMTGDYPEDPMAGFLPPYNPATSYEIGWMEFRVKPKADLPSSTQISNQALVQFDFFGPWGPAPKEGPWINTIDSEPPSSEVADLPPVVDSPSFLVSWNGTDDSTGSGISRYDIYYSDNGSLFAPWLLGANSTTTEGTFTGVFGHTYSFYSIATDNARNAEAAPPEADATTTVISTGGITLNFKAGWNMVSIPVAVANNSPSSVFPGVAGIFTWNATSRSYYVPMVIEPEKGYWVAVTENVTIAMTGTPVQTWTTDIKAGWNMIGSVSTNSSVAAPNDDPDGSVMTPAYWWDPIGKSYVQTTNLESGKGYWVASLNDCTLTL